MQHIPVLAQEVLDGLNLSPGASVVDATVGLGGHAGLILSMIGPSGRLFAFDRDRRNLDVAKEQLADWTNVTYVHDSFANIHQHDLPSVNAILFDLGFSSVHVDDPLRGFSFQYEGPLDMRYDRRQSLTAEEIVNSWSRDDLAALFRQLGEEPLAAPIAKAIFIARRKERIVTTTKLADIVASSIRRRGKTHPATKVFQAIRMAVNDELGQIEQGISAAIDLLVPGGRLAVISFHSLEDRLIKQRFKASEALSLVTKKPITARWEETKENPRARSAKLRVAEKI